MRKTTTAFMMALATVAGLGAAHADDSYRVNSGATATITEHTVCRKVTNNGGNPIMVATRTAAEWSQGTNAFLNNIADMDRVVVASCGMRYHASSGYNLACASSLSSMTSIQACADRSGQNVIALRDAGIPFYAQSDSTAVWGPWLNEYMYGAPDSLPVTPAERAAVGKEICETRTQEGVYGWFSWNGTTDQPALALHIHCIP